MIDEKGRNRINNLAKIIEDQVKEIKSITQEPPNEAKTFLAIVDDVVIDSKPTFERAKNRVIEALEINLSKVGIVAEVKLIVENTKEQIKDETKGV